MKLIEKYLNALSNYLPKDNKEDILKEVESIIHDMIDGDYSEENVVKVLKKLGHPRSFSMEYQPKKRYLIGPEYFDQYIKTLLFVTLLVGNIFLLLSIFGNLVSGIGDNSIFEYVLKIFSDGISSFISGAFTSAFIVTGIFYALEHTDYTFDEKFNVVKKSEWSPTMLREVPKKKPKQFKRGQLLVDIFFTVLFTTLFITVAKYIGVYQKGEEMVPLFNMEQFHYYRIVFIIMLVYYVIINLTMVYYKYPNYKVAIMKTSYNIINIIVFIVFINDSKLFNPNVKTKLAEITKISTEQFNSIFSIAIIVITILMFIGLLIDTIVIINKSYQNEKSQ